MRLTKEQVHHIAVSVVSRLRESRLLEVRGTKESLVSIIEKAIMAELMVETRLNEEVRELLKPFESEFEHGRADYQKMFSMTKQRLVRDRGLIL